MQNNYPKYDGPTLTIEIEGHHPYYLRPGESLTIGRSSKNNIIIKDATVSRQHATIRWDSKYPRIVDNSSTAGVVVDNDYVTFRHLHGLHRIKLGATYLRVQYAQTETECSTELYYRQHTNGLRKELDDSDEVTLLGESGSEDIIGYLADNKAIQKLLVHLEMSRRTGTLSVTEGSITGIIIFGLGKIRGVKCGKRRGYQALQHICSFSKASYHFTVIFNVGECFLNISPMCYLRQFNKRITKRRPRTRDGRARDEPLANSHDAEK